MKFLVTGFEPFGGETMNPAYEAVRGLPEMLEGHAIVTLRVPVVFQKGADLIMETIQKEQPDAVIMVGQAGGRTSITPERTAQNVRSGRIPDNEGNQPMNEPVSQGGKKLLPSHLPVNRIVRALKEQGIPSYLSYSAGKYVCNDVFYSVMEYIEEKAPTMMGGFIHVPFAPEQVKEKSHLPSLPIDIMTQALKTAILVTASSKTFETEGVLSERSKAMKLTDNVKYKYDHLFNYQEISDTLYTYSKEHPELCRVTVAGVTPEGRDILILEVTNTVTGTYEDKPAYYVEGNIHAGEITGCMSIMYFLDTIFSNLEDKGIQEILDKFTIYAMPRVSPDGSEHYLNTPDMVRSANRPYLYGDDAPGLVPCDLDGDGVIRRMRVKSPFGIWKESKEDPRVMTRRKPDDTEGEFYNVYSEGMIREYDGINITAAPQKFGYDFNRNYPVGWKPEQEQRGAGEYSLVHPETRANSDFLVSHPNICSVLDMHTMGGQILYTPGYKSGKEADREDMAIYRAIGGIAHEENGFPVLNIYDEYMPVGAGGCYGGFDDFIHYVLGVPAMTIECWDLDPRAGVPVSFPPKAISTEEEQENQALKYVQWIDKENDGEGITPWTKFDHPQLGEVEIGGIDYKRVVQNPPPKFLPGECEKQARVMLRQVKVLPHVTFDKVDIKLLGKAEAGDKNLYKVDVYVMNTGFFSSYVFKEGLKTKRVKPLTVALSGASIIEGKEKTEIGHLSGFSGVRGYNSGLGAMSMSDTPCEKKISYVLEGNPGDKLCVEVTGGHIGRATKEFTL